MDEITFAVLLTAAGAGIAAGIVTSLVSLVKTAFAKTRIGNWDGMVMAFLASGALYVVAAVATQVSTLEAGLGVFLAWLTCAIAAVGAHKIIINPIVDAAKKGGE